MQCRSICLVAFVKSLISMLLTLFALPFEFFRNSFIFVELNISWTTLVKNPLLFKACILPTSNKDLGHGSQNTFVGLFLLETSLDFKPDDWQKNKLVTHP